MGVTAWMALEDTRAKFIYRLVGKQLENPGMAKNEIESNKNHRGEKFQSARTVLDMVR